MFCCKNDGTTGEDCYFPTGDELKKKQCNATDKFNSMSTLTLINGRWMSIEAETSYVDKKVKYHERCCKPVGECEECIAEDAGDPRGGKCYHPADGFHVLGPCIGENSATDVYEKPWKYDRFYGNEKANRV
jgi:hypothetical protein